MPDLRFNCFVVTRFDATHAGRGRLVGVQHASFLSAARRALARWNKRTGQEKRRKPPSQNAGRSDDFRSASERVLIKTATRLPRG